MDAAVERRRGHVDFRAQGPHGRPVSWRASNLQARSCDGAGRAISREHVTLRGLGPRGAAPSAGALRPCSLDHAAGRGGASVAASAE